jgi:serine/threonine protein kinase
LHTDGYAPSSLLALGGIPFAIIDSIQVSRGIIAAMAPSFDETPDGRPEDRQSDDSFDAGAPDRVVPFGKYLLLGKIARGGMAEIYRARPATGVPSQLLAIKCMRAHLARESRFVEMFIREGKLAMMLDHPGIVRTFDVGSVDGHYFITMEHIAGKDLNHVLRRCQETGRRIPIPHALYVARCLAEALGYAHALATHEGRALSVVNRDVSLSNIRLSYEGDVKLLDFGIAQAVLQVTSEIGILKGKFSYMSPEQIRGLPLDRRTDIFSAGIVLHEMLTCERLFRDDSEFVLMEMVRRAEVRPPSAFNSRVPPELDRVVMHALERDPDLRYQDAASLSRDLDGLLGAYQFSSSELGEFVRSLFAADHRKDQAIVSACLAGAPGKEEQEPADVTRRHERQRSRRRRWPSPAVPPARLRSSLIWAISLGLLLLGFLILMLALR